MIKLRNIGPDEWELWRHQRLAALAEAPTAFKSKLVEWRNAPEKRWRDRLSIPGSYHLIAFLDGTAVGMTAGLPTDNPDVAALLSVWVCPTARGCGVGDALTAAVEEWARGTGAARLRLAVLENNHSARSLYLRNGFVDAGLEGVDLESSSAYRERVMLKELR